MRLFACGVMVLILSMSCAGNRNSAQIIDEQIQNQKFAISLEPSNPDHYVELARLYEQKGDYAQALYYCDETFKLVPGQADALYIKGTVAFKQKDYHMAVEQFRSVLFTDKSDYYRPKIGFMLGCPYRLQLISDRQGDNAFPAYANAREKIVFQSNRDGNWEIYLAKSDGSAIQRLTHHKNRDEMPAFLANDSTIIFSSTRDDTVHYRIENQVRKLFQQTGQTVSAVIQDTFDYWSPIVSGTTVYALREEPGTSQPPHSGNAIVAIDLLENSVQNVITGSGRKMLGDITSGSVLYYSMYDQGYYRLFRYTLEKKKNELIPLGDFNVYAPRISPDGDLCLFFSDRNNNLDIYSYRFSEKTLTRLTSHGALDGYPVFSFDGKRIYFHSNRDKSYQIYSLDLAIPVDKRELLAGMEAFLDQF